MTVSIIIAVKTWQKNLEECVAKCLALEYDDHEIIVLPDGDVGAGHALPLQDRARVPFRFIPTGPVGPAEKRDIGARAARGEILAFLDDDAYPCRDWLRNAVRYFKDARVAGVGGPAVTPLDDTLRQKASGAVFSSFLLSGSYGYRYQPRRKRMVDDFPSCNFLIRKAVFEQAGGFNTQYWPGEDTILCLEVTKRLRHTLIYAPDCLVYHHRRPLFLPHLRQIAGYALHRGYFVKRYPQTSCRFSYFLPSMLLAWFAVGLILSLVWPTFRLLYASAIALYLTLVLIFSLSRTLALIPLVFSGIIVSHLTYGFFFLKGLFSGSLHEERTP